jgi:hypothetical protein
MGWKAAIWQHAKPSMRRLALMLALAPAVALADENPRFSHLRESAEAISALGAFLDKYVGECGDVLSGGSECKANSSAFRKEATGKRHFMILNEDSVSMIQPGSYDPINHDFTYNVTPFFPAGGYALTLGSPKRTDAAGNPVLPLVYVKAKLPDEFNPGSMARLIGVHGLRMQVIFTPTGVWSLPKKGGGKMYGVQARIEALYLSIGRTGQELALWTAK